MRPLKFSEAARPKKIIAGSLILSFLLSLISAPLSYAAPGDETTYYFLNDHLGSVEAVLDDEGNVIERRDYLPYGEERYVHEELNSPDTVQGFAGKELDDELGLNYYGARYYDSVTGRFISADPWEGNLEDPQSLNKYSYARNNPLRYIDKSGQNFTPVDLLDPVFLGIDFIRVTASLIQTSAEGYVYTYATLTNNEELQDETYNNINKNITQLGLAATDAVIDTGLTMTPILPAIAGVSRMVKKTENAYDIAKNGGRHAGFFKNYVNRSADEIKKAVSSLEKQIESHTSKLGNPSKYVEDWASRSNEYKNGLKRKWQTEITGQREQKTVLEGILKN